MQAAVSPELRRFGRTSPELTLDNLETIDPRMLPVLLDLRELGHRRLTVFDARRFGEVRAIGRNAVQRHVVAPQCKNRAYSALLLLFRRIRFEPVDIQSVLAPESMGPSTFAA